VPDRASNGQQTAPAKDAADRVAHVVDYLEQRIFSGEYKAGDMLPAERELSAELGVSRSVVREALGKLDSLGLVQRRQGSGTRVAPPSKTPVLKGFRRMFQAQDLDLNDLTEARLPLEIAMVRLAATRRNDQHIQRLEEQQALLQNEQLDIETHLRADEAFHSILAEATGNPMFGMLLESVQYLRHEPYRKHYDQYQLRQAHAEHQSILDAVRAGDANAAETAVRAHLEKFISVQPDGERLDEPAGR
jgi:GntR family transcriptional repressor for pyruvate dehydrogenase complex